jgi:hypothetical protein
MTPQQQRAIDLRERLRNPPNAVADTGINLRNGAPVLRIVRPFQPSRWKTPTLTLIWELKRPAPSFIPIPPMPPDTPPGYRKPKSTAISIINETCAVWGIEQFKLLSTMRIASVVRPRHAAISIIRRLTPLSFPKIGEFLGGLDHTTCLYANRKLSDHIAALNQEFDDWSTPAEWVRALKARLEA